jgi:hypothetical protein
MPFLRTAARPALVASALVALSAVWWSPALAQDEGPTIIVNPPNGVQVEVPLSEVVGSIGPTDYDVRRRKGGRPQKVYIESGATVEEVLDHAGVSTGYSYVDIAGVRWSEDQITRGQMPPAVWFDPVSGMINLLRGSVDRDDVNYKERVKVSSPVHLMLADESGLKVTLSPSDQKVEVGDTVTFEATVTKGGFGEEYTYDWDFGDGGADVDTSTSTRAKTEYTFEKDGNWEVSLDVTTADDDGGDSVEIKVGKPKPSKRKQKGGGDNNGLNKGGYSEPPSTGSSSTDAYTPVDTKPPPPTTPADLGNTVEGNLLADISAPTSSATASALEAARTGKPDFEEPDGDGTLPPAAWAGLGALALMGTGAGLESGRRPRLRRRGLRRPRLRLPRR